MMVGLLHSVAVCVVHELAPDTLTQVYEEAASWLSRTFAPDVRKFVMRLVLGLSMANPAYANRYLVPVLLKKYEPLKPDLSAVELRWALDLMGSLVRRCDDVELAKRVVLAGSRALADPRKRVFKSGGKLFARALEGLCA